MITEEKPSGKPRKNTDWKEPTSSREPRNAHKILLLGGPTASGKSKLAAELSAHIPCEIVNADSRQIYRLLLIGTSQPTDDQLKGTPHHLYGFLDPREDFTAADFERVATRLIPEIHARKRLPVFVGGTGFYMKALLRGVWPVAPRNENLRLRLRQMENRHSERFLHRMLMRFDPVSAASIAPADTYRLIRAMEIFLQTGVRRSELPRNQAERFHSLKFFVDPDRDDLIRNIEKRTSLMLEQGWLEEVRILLKLYPDFETLPAARSLGYQEILQHLRGNTDLETCKQRIVLRTRQYAKRQLTWFRNQDGFQPVCPDDGLDKVINSVLEWYKS